MCCCLYQSPVVALEWCCWFAEPQRAGGMSSAVSGIERCWVLMTGVREVLAGSGVHAGPSGWF
jgi:hypothetical protein